MFISCEQNFEDVILYRALRTVPIGFYLDIDASHPEIDSVSRAFYEKGWSGINVEPIPVHAAALWLAGSNRGWRVNSLQRYRRHIH